MEYYRFRKNYDSHGFEFSGHDIMFKGIWVRNARHNSNVKVNRVKKLTYKYIK